MGERDAFTVLGAEEAGPAEQTLLGALRQQAEADAQLLMMDAFFGYSDRQATRRRRAIFSAKAFGVWVSLNILDIFLANV